MPIVKCPKCGKPVEWNGNEFRPFCSERCKMIDFGAWANEEYCVPDEGQQTTWEREAEKPSSRSDDK